MPVRRSPVAAGGSARRYRKGLRDPSGRPFAGQKLWGGEPCARKTGPSTRPRTGGPPGKGAGPYRAPDPRRLAACRPGKAATGEPPVPRPRRLRYRRRRTQNAIADPASTPSPAQALRQYPGHDSSFQRGTHPYRRRRAGGLRGGVAGGAGRRAGDPARDAAGTRHGRPPDRRPRRTGLLQFLPAPTMPRPTRSACCTRRCGAAAR